MTDSEAKLKTFQAENNVYTSGPALTTSFNLPGQSGERTFPLNPDDFQTSGKGQVAGLGGANLKDFERVMAFTQQLARRWTHKPWQHGFDD